MMLIVAIPGEGDGGKPRRALASMQEFKKLAFLTPSGRFGVTKISFVGITTPHHNQELIDKVIALHAPASDPRLPTHCAADLNDYPCETVRILTGVIE